MRWRLLYPSSRRLGAPSPRLCRWQALCRQRRRRGPLHVPGQAHQLQTPDHVVRHVDLEGRGCRGELRTMHVMQRTRFPNPWGIVINIAFAKRTGRYAMFRLMSTVRDASCRMECAQVCSRGRQSADDTSAQRGDDTVTTRQSTPCRTDSQGCASASARHVSTTFNPWQPTSHHSSPCAAEYSNAWWLLWCLWGLGRRSAHRGWPSAQGLLWCLCGGGGASCQQALALHESGCKTCVTVSRTSYGVLPYLCTAACIHTDCGPACTCLVSNQNTRRWSFGCVRVYV